MLTQNYQGHQQLPLNHTKQSKILQPEWPTRSQEERMFYTCLHELHWLPIKYRTTFKVLTIVYNTVQEKASQYLGETLKQKHFPRTTRQSTASSITQDIPFKRKKNHLLTGALAMPQQNIGMTSQNTSELQRI